MTRSFPGSPARPRALNHLARFRADVLRGLSGPVRELPCKYFYDERGSRLFEEICQLDEYYLTRTELAIMRRHAPAMADSLGRNTLLIEFGSGSSLKTRLLLDPLAEPAAYVPIDISARHLALAADKLAVQYPELEIVPVAADFTLPLRLPETIPPGARRVVYFPGSTIGNFAPTEAVVLLRQIRRLCRAGGGLLIGIDLKKERQILERAYNDSRGVTAAFNLNLLRRINRELGADFRLDAFRHHAFYNAPQGRIEMHLISREQQTVWLDGVPLSFAEGESIRTEYSHKYTVAEFDELAAVAGLELRETWTDERGWFAVLLFDACGPSRAV
jgi:dimethylhistidine N-methyltransferase